MEYFDFSAHDGRVFIPKSRHALKQKAKSCLVDRNRISKIKILSQKRKQRKAHYNESMDFTGYVYSSYFIYLILSSKTT